jgi:hypothetical protein
LRTAIRLYEWNCAVSGAFFEALADVEVVLRNSLHGALTGWHGTQPGYWYDDHQALLTPEAIENIAQARNRVARARKVETPGQVVAELSFGFWRFLLVKRYKPTLWRFALSAAFPNLPDADPDKLFARAGRLHALRNRIAHHEQIHTRVLEADLMDCRMVLRAIDPATERWVTSRERVTGLLSTRPLPHGPSH